VSTAQKPPTALVTGAAGAIGFAIAAALAEAGHAVALTDRDPATPRRRRPRQRARRYPFDITDTPASTICSTEIEARLRPDRRPRQQRRHRLVAPFLDLDLETWNRTLAINLTAPLVWTQAVARGMAPAARAASSTSPRSRASGPASAAPPTAPPRRR
jgi:NAD(P)-dependent dehydrogenase (short-subunit alcohol dehydrogenase family)